ncbi:MAG: VWA domain-containing protein [Treponema sp.]|nr:VWA domain-containing protein [Treponema sp.]MBP5752248.1 VWA domain-containing protein [Treponema sp.]
MMEFENPTAFFLLLLIPAFFFLRYLKLFKPITFPLTLGDWHGHYFQWSSSGRTALGVVSVLCAVAGFTCLVISYANPVVHHQDRVYSSRGADILFVLDTSPSMAAKDMAGMSRLQAAVQAIKTLEGDNTGDSVGLVEMAKTAAVAVPPTMDREVFFRKLDSVIIGDMGDGTAIGNGLSCAIFHLETSRSPRKSIVLITDGENNSGVIHPFTASRLAKEKNISVYVLGIGTKGTVPLEYVDPHTGKVYSGFLNSDYDSTVLSQIASEADGKFYEVSSLAELAQALDAVGRNESLVQSYHIKNTDRKFYHVFVFIAAALFLLSILIRSVILQEVL